MNWAVDKLARMVVACREHKRPPLTAYVIVAILVTGVWAGINLAAMI